ncbi:MAG: hypothetical protein FD123_3905 [Bacteroidetes bacterium]|nr:MAG: hypothetical protein FD123_3905 [Bacteroidota bacterium]
MIKRYFLSTLALGFVLALSAQSTAEEKLKKGDFNGALADFTTQIDKFDAEAQSLVKKRAEYEKMNEYERALVDGAQLLESKSDWAKLYFGRGQAHNGLIHKADAIKDFSMAIALDPKMGDAYYERAVLTATPDNKENACVDMATASSLGNEKAQVLFDDNFCWNLALQHYKEGASKVMLRDYENGLKELSQAIRLSPDSGRYYSKRGQAYLGLKQNTKAIADFTKATEKQPNSPDGYYQLGLYYYNQDDHEKCLEYFTKAVEKNPMMYDAYMYRAQANERLNKTTSAIYDWGRCVNIRPNDGQAYYRRGLLEKDMKNNIDACKDFNKAAQYDLPEAKELAQECLEPGAKKPKQPNDKKKKEEEEESGE